MVRVVFIEVITYLSFVVLCGFKMLEKMFDYQKSLYLMSLQVSLF